MKFTLALGLAIIVVLSITSSQADENVDSQWEKYKKDFNKKYSTVELEAQHKAIFEKNLIKVKEHNAKHAKGEVSYTIGINTFSDMTEEELSKHKGFIPHDHHH